MKIVHIITSLGSGGAENTLYKICKYDNQNEHIVITLKKGGKYLKLLNKRGDKVYSLDINFSIFHIIFKFFTLIRLLRDASEKRSSSSGSEGGGDKKRSR